MKKMMTGLVLTVAITFSTNAATIVWNFGDDNATFDSGTPANFSVGDFSIGNTLGTVADPVNSSSASSGYTGSSGTGNIGNAVAIGAFNSATSAYYSVTFTPTSGFALALSDFDFGTRSTATGPQAFALYSSADSFASAIFSGTIANNSTWSLKDNSFTAVNFAADTAITFRLYTYGGAGSPTSGTINNRLDDISISVTATAVPEPSTYALFGFGLAGLAYLRRKASK